MKNSINLLPKSYYESVEKSQKKGWISVWGFLAIFIIVLVSSVLVLADLVLSNIRTQKLADAKNLYKQQQSLSGVASKATSLTNRSSALDSIVTNSKNWDDTVQNLLSLQSKASVSFQSFISKNNRLEFTAIAGDLKDIAVFVNYLNASANFKDGQLINLFPISSQNKNSGKWQFTISVNS